MSLSAADLKLLKDPNWRLENLYFIVDKKARRRLFKRNNVQRIAAAYHQKRRRYLKSRQLGISTYELLRLFDVTIFTPNTTTCILAHEKDAIEKLFRIPRRAYDHLHPLVKPEIDKGGGSKYEMFFPEINSRIYCDLESRGDTIHRLHISEIAFIKDFDRVLSTKEAVPKDGYVTEESTPNGIANQFYDDWMDSDSNYTNIFLPWFFHEEYVITNHGLTLKDLSTEEKQFIDKTKKLFKHQITLDQIAYRRFKKRELKAKFAQEYPEDDISCFLTSGRAPFDLSVLKPIFDKAKPPIKEDRGIRIYEEMQKGEAYVIAADPAEGVGGDKSAAQVFKVRTREQVASFNGDTKPSDFADLLVYLSTLYTRHQPILIGVERNNHGHAVLLKLDEVLQYPNLYRAKDERLGWKTDSVTRPLMVDMMIEAIENGSALLSDKPTLGECLTLVDNNGKIQAQDGKHDDLFMAAALGLQMCLEESTLDIYNDIGSKILV